MFSVSREVFSVFFSVFFWVLRLAFVGTQKSPAAMLRWVCALLLLLFSFVVPVVVPVVVPFAVVVAVVCGMCFIFISGRERKFSFR